MKKTLGKIVMISRADAAGGGASRIAEDLAEALIESGTEAHHLCFWPRKSMRSFQSLAGGKSHRPMTLAMRASARMGVDETGGWELPALRRQLRALNTSLVHLHDVSSCLNPRTIMALSQEWPIVWTFHDCAAFTGGCLYPLGCERYMAGCGKCPQQGLWPLNSLRDLSARNLRARHRLFESCSSITVTAPSLWMSKSASSSRMGFKSVKHISYGIDTQVFQPVEKQVARDTWGLSRDELVVLVSAADLDSPRKGAADALSICRDLAREGCPVNLLLLGNASPDWRRRVADAGVRSLDLGFITEQGKLCRAYAAADVFLFCSYADNQPVSILESMASGTPVAAYASGGIPELIEDGVDGCLADTGDRSSLVMKVKEAYQTGVLPAWSISAAKKILPEYSKEKQLGSYLSLYAESLAQYIPG